MARVVALHLVRHVRAERDDDALVHYASRGPGTARPLGSLAHDAVRAHVRDVARDRGVLQLDGQVVAHVVAPVQVQPVDGDGTAAVGLEVGVHRVRVQAVHGRAGRRLQRQYGLAEVRLEPVLQLLGDHVRRWPVELGRGAQHRGGVEHAARAGVPDPVPDHVHQRVLEAREVAAADQHARAAGRDAGERLVAVHRRLARVLEQRVVHVLLQVAAELELDAAHERYTAGARLARHLVLVVRRHLARDVLPDEHAHRRARVQVVALDGQPGAAGDRAARGPHARDLGLDKVELLVRAHRHLVALRPVVQLRHVRDVHRPVHRPRPVARRRYGALDARAVLGGERQQALAVGHPHHDQAVLRQYLVVADHHAHRSAARPRPVRRFHGLDARHRAPHVHVRRVLRVRHVGQQPHVTALRQPRALVVARAPPAVVPSPVVVVPRAAHALAVVSLLGEAPVEVVQVQVVVQPVVERQRDAAHGHRDVRERRCGRGRVGDLCLRHLAIDHGAVAVQLARHRYLVHVAHYRAPVEQCPERLRPVVGHRHPNVVLRAPETVRRLFVGHLERRTRFSPVRGQRRRRVRGRERRGRRVVARLRGQ